MTQKMIDDLIAARQLLKLSTINNRHRWLSQVLYHAVEYQLLSSKEATAIEDSWYRLSSDEMTALYEIIVRPMSKDEVGRTIIAIFELTGLPDYYLRKERDSVELRENALWGMIDAAWCEHELISYDEKIDLYEGSYLALSEQERHAILDIVCPATTHIITKPHA